MSRDDVIARLLAAKPTLEALEVGSLFLFGSYARGEATAGSDLDVFVDAGTERFYELSNYMGALQILQDAAPGLQIGYATREGLSKRVRADVEQQAIRIF